MPPDKRRYIAGDLGAGSILSSRHEVSLSVSALYFTHGICVIGHMPSRYFQGPVLDQEPVDPLALGRCSSPCEDVDDREYVGANSSEDVKRPQNRDVSVFFYRCPVSRCRLTIHGVGVPRNTTVRGGPPSPRKNSSGFSPPSIGRPRPGRARDPIEAILLAHRPQHQEGCRVLFRSFGSIWGCRKPSQAS